jgi:F0F1-type ATP synthase delta subunit
LKHDDFIITTYNEIEVCREALTTVTHKTAELKQLIQNTKDDIDKKQADASTALRDQIQKSLQNAIETLANNGEIEKLELAVGNLETDLKQVFYTI